MSTAKIIPFPIERLRAKALAIGEGHAVNVGIACSSSRPEKKAGRVIRSVRRSASRGLAAHIFCEAVEQSEMLHVEVAAALDVDTKTERLIRDGERAFEVGHLLMLPDAARERVIKAIVEQHELLKASGR